MGKINGCLKCLFIFFNVLFAILGCLLIYGAVRASDTGAEFSSAGTPGIGWAWVFAIGVLVISCLGIYAGCSEKPLVLKIFAGFMVAGIIVMLIFGIYAAVTRNKLKDLFTSKSETSDALMQNDAFRQVLLNLQTSIKCCGLSSPKDWGSVIPDSCACEGSSSRGFGLYESEACRARPGDMSGPSQIYAKSCGEYIFDIVDLVMKISMGVCFAFAATALLGLLVTLLMLHQIKRYDGEGPAMSMKNY